ncbi:MAG: protein kinase [Acidobacteriota bacterium]|nr:protein kinase [Blastocatellia bacterium]MDW8412047.1 protein kinase [Acidobacteriota bacterium]
MKECISCFCCYDDEASICLIDGGELRIGLPGKRLLDERYRVDKLIARGRLGNIYKATQVELDRTIAIKVLHPALVQSEIARERFRREALATAALNHPAIITVLDFGITTTGLVYLVTEFLEGESLDIKLLRFKRLDIPEAVRIAIEVCEALQHAHDNNAIHRNLKPSNVFLLEGKPVEKVKLIDFGLVKLTTDSLRSITSGALIGSLEYCAPEQCEPEANVDHRSDIYSLGTILYQMLTGTLPYKAANKTELIRKKLSQKPPPPHLIVFDIPPELEKIVLKSLEIDPEQRYSSAMQMAEALSQVPRKATRPTIGLFTDSAKLAEQLRARLQARLQPQLRNSPLLSRRRELDRLEFYFEQVNEGRSVAVAIIGSPGIGKSRLLEEFRKTKLNEQCCLLSGEFDGKSDLLEIGQPKKLKEFFSDDTELTAKLNEPFSEAIFSALSTKLLDLSQRLPVVLLLDKIELADPVSLEFLLYLVGKASSDRLLLVLAADLQEVVSYSSKISRWLARLSSLRPLQTIELQPISDVDFPEFIQHICGSLEMPDPATELEKLYYATEGNPAQVYNLLSELISRQSLIWNGQSWIYKAEKLPIPRATTQLLERQLKYLSTFTRRILELASVLGNKFGFEALSRFAQVSESNLIDAIDELLSYRLIEESDKIGGDEGYKLSNTMLQQYLYESFSEERRQQLHLEAARVYQEIDEAGELYDFIARHLELAGKYAESFSSYVAATKSSWREGELQRARSYLLKAKTILARLDILKADVGSKVDLIDVYCDYLMLAVELKAYEHHYEAEQLLEQALQLAHSYNEPYLVARSLVALGHYQQTRGELDRAIGYFEHALELYQQIGNTQRTQVLIEKLDFLRKRLPPK